MREGAVSFPYERKMSFLSPPEIAYYKLLNLNFGDRYLIFAQVRVLDLCEILDRPFNQGAFNRIARKHVDFVLCHPRTFKPMVAIELDDSTHDRPDRRSRESRRAVVRPRRRGQPRPTGSLRRR